VVLEGGNGVVTRNLLISDRTLSLRVRLVALATNVRNINFGSADAVRSDDRSTDLHRQIVESASQINIYMHMQENLPFDALISLFLIFFSYRRFWL